MSNVPTRAFESGFEDIQHVEKDISTLFNTFIQPIEDIRSIARPAISSSANKSDTAAGGIILNDYTNVQINNSKPLESRAHTFYRMLGLPVVVEDGSFYNPGFPSSLSKADSRKSINDKFSKSSLQTLINRRETLPQDLLGIFERQDIASSVYALLLRYTKPFQVLKTGGKPLDVDQQTFTVDVRNLTVFFFSTLNTDISDSVSATSSVFAKTPVGASFTGGQHILKPFITDPRIVNTVMKEQNMIAVPFLKDKKALQVEPNIYVKRPGIELIIRQRLEAQSLDSNFLNDVKNLVKGASTPGVQTSNLDFETLRSTISALADENKIDNEVVDKLLSGFSSTQVVAVSNLIKLIKSVINQLNISMQAIDRAQSQINWIPLPSSKGPETGSRGAVLNRLGANNTASQIDAHITELRIKKLNSDRTINELKNLGDFASPFNANVGGENITLYEEQLQELISKRDKIANEAFNAMGNIEIITGEISGLGLIDIFAIYSALWAIDIKSLIGLLDGDSFQRLIDNNPALKDVATQAHGTSVLDALTDLEQKVINILSFADSLLLQQLSSPLQATGGSI